jgi:hypothetical protein
MTKCHYRSGQHDVGDMEYARVDRGANGGICDTYVVVLEGSKRFVDVVGFAGHNCAGTCIYPQGICYCHIPPNGFTWKGKSMLSCLQNEAHGADTNDSSKLLPGGTQRIFIDG